MALEMLKLVKAVAPVIFRDAGPGCLTGPCPEGSLTCGKTKEVREFFRSCVGARCCLALFQATGWATRRVAPTKQKEV